MLPTFNLSRREPPKTKPGIFESAHCNSETDFLPCIPSGEVIDSTRIERGLCDNRQAALVEGKYALTYKAQEETAGDNMREVFTELLDESI